MTKENPRARSASKSETTVATAVAFDYSSAAELFPTRSRTSTRRPMGYRRFAKAADAIRYAIEELPPELLIGAYLEVEEERFDSNGIRQLYDSAEYPLPRASAARQ